MLRKTQLLQQIHIVLNQVYIPEGFHKQHAPVQPISFLLYAKQKALKKDYIEAVGH